MAEVIYGGANASGDCRAEINAYNAIGDKGYRDEKQLRGALITRSLQRATRVINGYLEPVYPDRIPFATVASVPLLINSIANDLAVCYVMRSKYSGAPPMSDDMKKMYCEDTIAMLEKLAKREMELPEVNAVEDYPDTYDSTEDYVPVFEMDNVEKQFVDENRLEDVEDDREDATT